MVKCVWFRLNRNNILIRVCTPVKIRRYKITRICIIITIGFAVVPYYAIVVLCIDHTDIVRLYNIRAQYNSYVILLCSAVRVKRIPPGETGRPSR